MQESGSGLNESTSGAAVQVFWYTGLFALLSAYTANLTAFLTQARLVSDIGTVADLLNSPSYQYGTLPFHLVVPLFMSRDEGIIGSTGTETSLKRMKGDVYKTIYRRMQEAGNVIFNESHGIQRVAPLCPCQ